MSADIQAFDFSVDLMRAILWQYNDAARLQAILQAKQDWYDANQEAFWTDWFRDVFDLRTANDFGMAVWSIILDQPLVADVGASPETQPAFGFGEYHFNFGRGNFVRGAPSAQRLTREQKRLVLRLRYLQLVSRGTVPEINRALASLFANDGSVYVLDGEDMTLVYVFTFTPPASVALVLDLFDLLPRPAGVGVRIVVATPTRTWGFGRFHRNFDRGNFAE